MEGPTIYCQKGFLEQFIKKASESLDSLFLNTESSVDAISACFKLLYGKSSIVIDASPEILTAHPHPLVKKLIKNPTAYIQCNTQLEESLAEDDFWHNTTSEVFMLDKTEREASALEADWGMLILTIDNLAKKVRFLNPSPPVFISMDQDSFNWDKLAFIRHCFHTAILVDNYIDSKEQDLRNNILPLLHNLSKGMPKKRKMNLSIVTTSDNIQDIYNKLQKLLNEKNIKVNLSVSKTQSLNNHDRHCITNQIWISSGFGFNILSYNYHKRKLLACRDTTMFIMPRISNDQLLLTVQSQSHHTGTYFSAANTITQKMNELIEKSKTPRGTQKWYVNS